MTCDRIDGKAIGMNLSDLITPEGVIATLRAKSKKQALQELAERAGTMTGLDQRAIFEILLQRERLGSTGFGRGIAIPHGKIRGLRSTFIMFARLEGAIDFASCFRAIRAMKYDGWVTIELYPYIDDPDLAARTALTRVQEILAKA